LPFSRASFGIPGVPSEWCLKLGVVVPSIHLFVRCFFDLLHHHPMFETSSLSLPSFVRSFVRPVFLPFPSRLNPLPVAHSFPAFLKGLESAPSLPFPSLPFPFFLSCLSYSLSLLGLGFQVGCLLGFLSAALACQTPSSLTWHSAIGSLCPPQHLPWVPYMLDSSGISASNNRI
jgi:hypothetical protein